MSSNAVNPDRSISFIAAISNAFRSMVFKFLQAEKSIFSARIELNALTPIASIDAGKTMVFSVALPL